MKYLCLVYGEEKKIGAMTDDDCMAYDQALRKEGRCLASEALQPVNTATTVRVREGKVSIRDGPFTETKECLAGFYLIEAADLNEAIQFASKMPPASVGCVEVRPIRELASTSGERRQQLEPGGTFFLTRRASRRVTQLYDLVLSPTGIKTTQSVLLRAIVGAGKITQCQLGESLSITVETLSRRLAALRRLGWVDLSPGSDKREHLYSATALGRQQLERAKPYWQRAEERLRQQLGDRQWTETHACLDRLALAAERSLLARRKNVAPPENS